MRYLVIIFSILIFGCNSKPEDKVLIQDKQKPFSEIDTTFPFSEADKVEVVSFSHMDYRPEDSDYKIIGGKVGFDESIIKERVSLNNKQQEDLFRIINTNNCPKNYTVADCYMPEHRITFYKDGKVIAFLEVCIQCVGKRVSDGFNVVPLCGDKMKELKTFFGSAGIKHFSEM